jgi:histidinol phosphatase-like PHP family hydrolase
MPVYRHVATINADSHMHLNDTRELHLFPNEVFTADEAALIYYHYFLTDHVPEPYVLRQMNGA